MSRDVVRWRENLKRIDAADATQLLAEIWADWDHYSKTGAVVWNPSVALFEKVKAWAERVNS